MRQLLQSESVFDLSKVVEVAMGTSSVPTIHLGFKAEGDDEAEGATLHKDNEGGTDVVSKASHSLRLVFYDDAAREHWKRALDPCLVNFVRVVTAQEKRSKDRGAGAAKGKKD